MAWYNGGTVTVTNGSTVVTGAGTDFVNNVSARDAFALIGGNPNEIASVDSKTQLTLARPWLGATANGVSYVIQPTVGIYVDLALRALNMLVPFQTVIDGVGQGLFADGSSAMPGMRFLADQDTGIFRAAQNTVGVSAGGVNRVSFTPDNTFFANNIDVSGANPIVTFGSSVAAWGITIPTGVNAIAFIERQFNSEKMRISGAGYLLVGATSGNCHTFKSAATPSDQVMVVGNAAGNAIAFYGVDQKGAEGANASTAAVKVGSTTSGRSISATGTINASGADYAEYMTKADGCGTIVAGDVCGVDIDGKLTRYWAAAMSFVVKSTDPSLVGGDIWADHMAPKPEAPGLEPIAPGDAPVMPDSDEAEALATWHEAAVAHTALVIAYPGEHAAWVAAQTKYEAALDAWEADLETARQCVDRIAFCGQVPVNVTGDFAVGDYIIAVANGSGIKAVAVTEADITFDQYRRRIGKIWAVRDGRAWIDVQHG